MQTISEYFTPEEIQRIKEAKIKEFRAVWYNKKGEPKEKTADNPESLYFYEYHYGAVIYIDTKFRARKRLQRILRAVA